MTIHDQAQQAVQELRRVGRIVSVAGAHAVILVDQDGDPRAKTPEIGTLLRVDTPRAICLCVVSAMSSPVPSHAAGEAELRIVEVEFLGELPKDAAGASLSFRRGISCYPALGDVAMRASKEELEKAYACDSATAIRMGHIAQDESIPAMVKIDDLLGKHFAILGATGTGKSCTLALLLRRILEKSPHGHLLLLDVHREYASAFKDMAEVITPADLNLPFWLLTFEEIVEILIGQPTSREADIEILREIIPIAKLRYMKNRRRERAAPGRHREAIDPAAVGVDTPIPYRSSDLIAILDEKLEKLGPHGDPAPCKRLKARLEAINRDSRYGFMFGSLTVEDTMSQVLSRLFRIPVAGKPIAIVELGGLPSEIINVVVSVLARLAFDFGIWSGGRIPLTFVCEEAHRYVPAGKSLGFEPAKRAISRIAKEGRKYGLSLGIVSQRPAELDATILSQCSTIFSMRLANERDQQILRAGVPDAAASLLDVMPAMGMGEAIAFGEGVGLPARIKIDIIPPEFLPMSSSASFTRSWARELSDGSLLQDIVQRWRHQNRTPDNPRFDFGGSEAQPETGFTPHGEDIQSLARLIRQFRG
jgi:DNA helicase HerA-like ATPase